MPTLSDLKPDKRNARKHTPRNVGMIESSMQRDGFGRSVLLANNDGTIIAGNATIDAHYCDVIVTRWQNFTGETAVFDG
jgi:hypothetical protein